MRNLKILHTRGWVFLCSAIMGITCITWIQIMHVGIQGNYYSNSLKQVHLLGQQDKLTGIVDQLGFNDNVHIEDKVFNPGLDIHSMGTNPELSPMYRASKDMDETYQTVLENYQDLQNKNYSINITNKAIVDYLDFQFTGWHDNQVYINLRDKLTSLPANIRKGNYPDISDVVNKTAWESAILYRELSKGKDIPGSKKIFVSLLNDHLGELNDINIYQQVFNDSRAFYLQQNRRFQVVANNSRIDLESVYQSRASFSGGFLQILIVGFILFLFRLIKPEFFTRAVRIISIEKLVSTLPGIRSPRNTLNLTPDDSFENVDMQSSEIEDVITDARNLQKKFKHIDEEIEEVLHQKAHSFQQVRTNMEKIMHVGGEKVNEESIALMVKDFDEDVYKLDKSVKKLMESTQSIKKDSTIMRDVEGNFRNV